MQILWIISIRRVLCYYYYCIYFSKIIKNMNKKKAYSIINSIEKEYCFLFESDIISKILRDSNIIDEIITIIVHYCEDIHIN